MDNDIRDLFAYSSPYYFFSGVFLGVTPFLLLLTILKKMLQEYSFYVHAVDAAILLLNINCFINPLYAFIKLANVRQGLKDLFKCP